ncbi:MAG: YdjY domain-containing protein [Planctomycetota bacterium]|nr:YdjY domain-containing protein [Planctomycetota bacterium]
MNRAAFIVLASTLGLSACQPARESPAAREPGVASDSLAAEPVAAPSPPMLPPVFVAPRNASAAAPSSTVPSPWIDAFPHVRVDLKRQLVEIHGEISVDAHNPETPKPYLEVMVCAAGTREHEALVVTRARASHVHAALLMIGLAPGKPGSWKPVRDAGASRLERVQPTGDSVVVWMAPAPSPTQTLDFPSPAWSKLSQFVLVEPKMTPLGGVEPSDPQSQRGWVFAGSFERERPAGGITYQADLEGNIVGLTTFGDEVVAWREVHSHAADHETPAWLPDPARLPPAGTPVRVIISR